MMHSEIGSLFAGGPYIALDCQCGNGYVRVLTVRFSGGGGERGGYQMIPLGSQLITSEVGT
jgi:hypothetical protein